MADKKELLIIIPAYNESENILKVLEQLEASEVGNIADFLVINDASTDGMDLLVQEQGYPIVTQLYNMGYGCALQTGYKFATTGDYEYVIQMDGDGQHDISNIPRIYEALRTPGDNGEYPDIILCSRFRPDSAPFPTSISKKIVYKFFRGIIKLLTGRKIADPTTGLQGLSRRAFLYYSQYNHFDDQYPDANMLILMMLLGFNVVEIPAVMHPRTAGKSIHSGLKPFWYMFRVLYSILIILIQVKILKMDAGAGKRNADKA